MTTTRLPRSDGIDGLRVPEAPEALLRSAAGHGRCALVPAVAGGADG